MKFSKKLQDLCDKRFSNYYISYKNLKKAIKLITGTDTSLTTIRDVTSNFEGSSALAGASYRPPEARFLDLINDELKKINDFALDTCVAIEDGIRLCINGLSVDEGESFCVLSEILKELRILAEKLVFLEDYRRLNFIGFRKITKKYDKHNQRSAAAWHMARIVKEKFVKMNLTTSTRLLSNAFALYRYKNHIPSLSDPTTSYPESVYLIKDEHIARVQNSLLEHVALETTSNGQTFEQSIWIYFDTPHFDAYDAAVRGCGTHARIGWFEGSTSRTLQVIDSQTSTVVKKLELSPDTAFKVICEGLSSASSWASGDDLDVVLSSNQIGCYATISREISFGDACTMSQNMTHISLVENEDGRRLTKLLMFEQGTTYPEGVISSFGILRVRNKTLDECIHDSKLISKDCLIKLEDYCEFVNGAFHVFQAKLKNLPNWSDYILGKNIDDIFEPSYHSSDNFSNTPKHGLPVPSAPGSALSLSTGVDVLYSGSRSRWVHEHEANAKDFSSTDGEKNTTQNKHSVAHNNDNNNNNTSSLNLPSAPRLSYHSLSYQDLVEPLLNEITLNQTTVKTPDKSPVAGVISAENERPGEETSFFWTRLWKFLCLHDNSGSTTATSQGAMVRVEPKTFFANERTLLQWMNTAVLLSTISITLLHLGPKSANVGGMIMGFVSIFFLIYAFRVYLRRSISLEKREPINYNDRLGPAMLVVILVIALSTVMLLKVKEEQT